SPSAVHNSPLPRNPNRTDGLLVRACQLRRTAHADERVRQGGVLTMRHVSMLRAAVPLAIVLGTGCLSRPADHAPFPALPVDPETGPAVEGERRPFTRGDAARGRDVYRYETFGNEGFWTDAVRLPQGIIAE